MSRKRPKQKENVRGKKTPFQGGNPDAYMSKKPCWRFSNCDKSHDRWKVDYEKINEKIFNKLIAYENMTWKEIHDQTNGRGHKKNHFIGVDSLIKEAQNRFNELKIAEDTLFSLAPEGKLRLYGRLYDGVFDILWIDLEHEVCTSNKKHT
ncbi:hypothetical protein [Peptostreptococcus stomatis]